MKRILLAVLLACSVGLGAQQAASYEAITVAGTAIGITSTVLSVSIGGATTLTNVSRCFMTLETAPVRWRIDGSDPTASVGHLLDPNSNSSLEISGFANLTKFRAIRTTGVSGALKVTCFL